MGMEFLFGKGKVSVQVAFAEGGKARCWQMEVPAGTTAAGLAAAAAFEPGCPADRSLSVWGRRVAPGYVLAPGDRLELCGALAIDPKEGRRLRARRDDTEIEALRRRRGRRA